MRRAIVCVCAYLILVTSSYKVVSADEGVTVNNEVTVSKYIYTLYNQLDFSRSEKLSYDVFEKAYRGYMNLRDAGKLNTGKQILTVCNFSLPSTENRMWVIDLTAKKVLFNTYVAHGEGSGDDCSLTFSNRGNTHKSSLGYYVTGNTYSGEHGTSLHLSGMDEGYNDAAYERGIVVHGADYVCEQFVNAHQRLGRSWGCPAVPSALSLPIINAIKDGTCLFIYYPDAKYARSSYWLNKRIATQPGYSMYDSLLEQEVKAKPREIQYIHNGKVDSVKVLN